MSSPIGIAAYLLTTRKSQANRLSSGERTSLNKSYRATVADQNLAFVLLAALGEDVACTCRLIETVHGSSAVFLPLPSALLQRELEVLAESGLVKTVQGESCERGCASRYESSNEGRQFLESCIEDLRLSNLASRAFLPFPAR
jgi:hypothetical protein